MTDTCISGDKTRKFETDYYNNDSALLAQNININKIIIKINKII